MLRVTSPSSRAAGRHEHRAGRKGRRTCPGKSFHPLTMSQCQSRASFLPPKGEPPGLTSYEETQFMSQCGTLGGGWPS
ncbi:Hypothetical protein CAP_4554 [Chondromyces apiculatus DSM 436]|uniref:Uncharacterized protein n=1 Tax=Chondromyces apiculatus DSM 436 TaxID=1192034 RepID=A0A017T6J5_9BACT|nr:Hypothetical protein CAP_4554 [Chondromyces apiculatus DSM 436]